MARVKVIITRYSFNRPQLLTEHEYISYKQMLKVEPNYSLGPKGNFWAEFPFTKWLLIAIAIGGVLAVIWEGFGVIAGIALFLLMFDLISGTPQSMINYQGFLNEKNRYFSALKETILTSKDYADFRQKAQRL